MKRVSYIFALCVLYPISWLPFPVLYLISDFSRIVLYNLIGYRKKVVRENLQNAFPEKSKTELLAIEKAFYKNLCDITLESIKSLSISKVEISKRCEIQDIEILDYYEEQQQSVVAVLGHYGNWEWAALSSALSVSQDMVVIYKPIRNQYIDAVVRNTRSRFGVKLVAMRDVARFYIENREETFVNCFVSDQSPSNPSTANWLTFLNQPTAVLPGAEKLARKFDHPVVFVSLKRVKRGFYKLNMKTIVENSKETTTGEITAAHTKALEEQINAAPADWLWSHKRWKHTEVAANKTKKT